MRAKGIQRIVTEGRGESVACSKEDEVTAFHNRRMGDSVSGHTVIMSGQRE